MAAQVFPDPRVAEAWGLTLHPSQPSGPKSVQGSGMPEPGSRQLGSCLASGCLPGNHALPVLPIFRNAFRFHPAPTSFHTFTKDTFVFLSWLGVPLLRETYSLHSIQSCLPAWALMVALFPLSSSIQ